MQEQHLFEYAIIRIVPRVEREEFINVGVIVYCARQRFLQTLFTLPQQRLQIFAGDIDLDALNKYLCAIEHICRGDADGGPIARLDMASRFRWLTATRSTVVQTSRVHPGLCTDALTTLTQLYNRFVL